MKVEEIERLLAEFYEGNTSEQEEELLKAAFRNEEMPAHLQRDKRLFLSSFCKEQELEDVPAGLAQKLSRMIDEKAEEEQLFFRRNTLKRNWRWIGGTAATILLLFGIGYGIINRESMREPTLKDTFTNPEDAYKTLQSTLIEVSTNLNQGIQQVEATKQDLIQVNKEVRNELIR